jgi:CRP/FNR family transcriptional regulator
MPESDRTSGWLESDLHRRILPLAQPLRAPAGRVFFRAGDDCRGLLLLDRGSVRVYLVTGSAREVTLYRIAPGEACVLSTQCLMTGESYRAEGVAETEVTGLFLPAGRVEELMARDADFRHLIFRHYGERLIDLVMLVEDLLGTPIEARLAQYLVAQSAGATETAVTHQIIAADLGTAREVVSRHLKEFERRGLVSLSRGRIGLTNRAGLQAVAQARGP